MDTSQPGNGSAMPLGTLPTPTSHLPSPAPISPGLHNNTAHSSSSSTSTSYQSSSSSSLLPSLPVGIEATLASGAPASQSRGPMFPPPIIPFDPNAASDDDDEDEDGGSPRKKRRNAASGKNGKTGGADGTDGAGDEKGRRKIEIEYITKKEKRHITFSKRKAGIMKKAYELATLTGTQVLLLVVSETGIVYTFTTTKFQPLVGAGENGQPSEGQRLIQKCLAVDPNEADSDYISPPPDGPLLPLPPSAQKRPFEANSPIHGGQIALRTKQQRPRAKKPAPIPIVPPPASTSTGSLPNTPSIHATLEGGLPIPPSPHHNHPLSQPPLPSPGHQLRDYPPSPGYPPGPNGQRDPPSVLQSASNYNEMMERSSLNAHPPSPYGPPSNYPPPPALGYTHAINSNRPPHPLDPYPHHQQQPHPLHHQSHNSPSSSPQAPRRYLQPQQSYPAAAAPRSLAGSQNGPDPYGDHRMHYVDDPQMMMPQHHHGGPPPSLPQPPAEMYLQPHQQPQGHLQPAPQHHRMYSNGNEYGPR
ncbi:uncharacterized protein JCM15063_001359 [Sporobolomyces koalae]|uniref:uncharacterized protein n=1 Tax=Sporobolomyces koalae TaxID=500713 RepID=UPI00316FF698